MKAKHEREVLNMKMFKKNLNMRRMMKHAMMFKKNLNMKKFEVMLEVSTKQAMMLMKLIFNTRGKTPRGCPAI